MEKFPIKHEVFGKIHAIPLFNVIDCTLLRT